jgi:hypothetical protein
VKLPGSPNTYFSGTTGSIAVSPDGRCIFYERHDRKDGDIMLVENFR